MTPWYNGFMPAFRVSTAQREYSCIVRRGAAAELASHLPARTGKLFIVTTRDVWDLHGAALTSALAPRPAETLFFPGGEDRKRLAEVESLAGQMVERGADRSSLVIAFGGGIVGDLAGFLAAIFMRGIPVIQVPTTLLAQVDAGVGGKTGANLEHGKNLIGAFHQPLAVLIDPAFVHTLPEREYRAGLYEVLKCGVISSPSLFGHFESSAPRLLARDPGLLDEIIAEAVRIKAEVVTADEREGDLRRILNFGHTLGHALEAETAYARLLHGEAIAFGMRAAAHLARLACLLPASEADRIRAAIAALGAIPPLSDIDPARLVTRLSSDKKTVQGRVHFVLPDSIGHVVIRSNLDPALIQQAAAAALADLASSR